MLKVASLSESECFVVTMAFLIAPGEVVVSRQLSGAQTITPVLRGAKGDDDGQLYIDGVV